MITEHVKIWISMNFGINVGTGEQLLAVYTDLLVFQRGNDRCPLVPL